ATPYSGDGGGPLQNFIFSERCRERIGEAHRYFDLIRTRRIMNSGWTRTPMNIDQYNRRAWTWPLHESARIYNPQIVLNEYWTTIGRKYESDDKIDTKERGATINGGPLPLVLSQGRLLYRRGTGTGRV